MKGPECFECAGGLTGVSWIMGYDQVSKIYYSLTNFSKP